MHIPDGFLDPKVSTSMTGAAVFALSFCLAKVHATVTALVPAHALAAAGRGAGIITGSYRRILTKFGEQKIYRMGMTASLVFAAQMFNFPINSGTSGHLIGGVLAAVLLGPFAGTIALAVVLLVQAFFFADGGLLALGANIINMAVLGSFACYYLYYYLKKIAPEAIAIMAAAWTSVVLAALACSLQIGFSGTAAFSKIIPAMMRVHVVIGIAEALITLAGVYLFRSLIQGDSAAE